MHTLPTTAITSDSSTLTMSMDTTRSELFSVTFEGCVLSRASHPDWLPLSLHVVTEGKRIVVARYVPTEGQGSALATTLELAMGRVNRRGRDVVLHVDQATPWPGDEFRAACDRLRVWDRKARTPTRAERAVRRLEAHIQYLRTPTTLDRLNDALATDVVPVINANAER